MQEDHEVTTHWDKILQIDDEVTALCSKILQLNHVRVSLKAKAQEVTTHWDRILQIDHELTTLCSKILQLDHVRVYLWSLFTPPHRYFFHLLSLSTNKEQCSNVLVLYAQGAI